MTTSAAGVLAVLRRRQWTLGVAESLTGGAVCAEFVSVPGASDVLRGGLVAYATPVKHSVLGVDAALLAARGAVHPEVALQMARGVRAVVAVDGRAADVGIATTGIAGPESPDGQPVGTVFVAVATPQAERVVRFAFDGDRSAIRAQTVAALVRLMADMLGE
jgi:nicotinamide-nucleotide amidase